MVSYEKYYYKEEINMKDKELVLQEIESLLAYREGLEIGSDAYDKVSNQLTGLRKELADLEKTEAENDRRNREMAENKKDRRVKNTLEGVKIIGGGIIMPCIGYVVVTAFEKDDSFTSALKKVVDCFIPKKLN